MEKIVKYLGILAIILTLFGWINSVFVLNQGIVDLTSILYILLIIVSIAAVLLADKNLKISSLLLIVIGVLVCCVKLFTGTTVGFGILGALTAVVAGGLGVNKENPVLPLAILAAIMSLVGWINSVFILEQGFMGITSIIYIISIIIAIVCAFYSEKGIAPSAILLVTGLAVFIIKLFLGISVGIGILGAVIAIIAGAVGLKKDNPTFYLAIIAGVIAIVGIAHALTTDPFVMGMLSFVIGGLIFIIAGTYSDKDLNVASTVLIIMAVALVLVKLMSSIASPASGTWVTYIAPLLALIAGAIGLAKE